MKTKIRKQVISIWMVIAMMCSGVFTLSVGQTQTARAAENNESDESKEDEEYIEIRNVSELYAIRNNLSGKYRLMNDIDLTEATSEGGEVNNTGHGWDPIDGFCGTLDGNGHVIKGMKIYGEVSGNIGLFGILNKRNVDDNISYIKNLGMVDVDIDVTSSSDIYCGAFAGYVDYANGHYSYIEHCFVSGNIKVNGEASSKTGGFVGRAPWKLNISNSYNLAKISSVDSTGKYDSNTGGFSGNFDVGQIENCYNMGVINDGMGYGMGKPHSYFNPTISNSFYLAGTASEGEGTPLTEAQMKNANYFTGWDFDTVWEIDPYSNYKYPQLKSCFQTRIKSMTIDTPPAKTEYVQGEPLDITGATMKVIYEDGLETTIFLTEDMLGDYNMMSIGEQQIPVQKGNATTTLKINVNAIPVTSVTISKTSTSIYKGYTEQLSASVVPETATYKGVEWSSADETIATVSQDGTITGKNPGTVTIRAASQNGVMAECQVTVTVPSVLLQLDAYDVTINKGDTYVPTYKLSPVDSTDRIKWTSSDEAVVHIDDKNQLIGMNAGVVTVTGVADSGVSAICTVTVMQDLSEFTVLNIKDVEYTGKALTQKPTVTNGTKTLRAGADYKIEYSSNVNVGKATVKIIGIGSYKGTLVREFNILPASAKTSQNKQTSTEATQNRQTENTRTLSKTTISSIKASKKKLVVKWKRVKNASGYKIMMAKNRAFTKGKKTYTVGKNTLKKTLKGAKKTTYYIRVQAYTYDESGQIRFGGYSRVKRKKTK